MHRYSEMVKADVRRWMSQPARQLLAQIFKELGTYFATLYACGHTWQAQRVPIG